MSTDLGIGCRTCRDAGLPREAHFTGEWNNCRDVTGLRKLIEARDIIVAAHRMLGNQFAVTWANGFDGNMAEGVAAFFEAHDGHTLAPMDEYGRFDDQCGKPVNCGSCGHRGSCVRERGHDPPCVTTGWA